MGCGILADNSSPVNIINLFIVQGDTMVKIKIEDVLFWIFIAIIVGTALWLLHGSPPEASAIITIASGVAASELLIWKKIFSMEKCFDSSILKMDKNVSLSFMKIKNDMDKNNLIINNKLDNINNKLNKRK